MQTAIGLILLSILAAQSGCPVSHQRLPDCIALPETADKREIDISTKLAADLFASIGKPSLAIEYKHNVDIAYAKLGQKNLEQLVLIEFLVCMRKEHAADVSPETLASMDRALQRAINRLAPTRAMSSEVSVVSKQKLRDTPYGNEKVQALAELGK